MSTSEKYPRYEVGHYFDQYFTKILLLGDFLKTEVMLVLLLKKNDKQTVRAYFEKNKGPQRSHRDRKSVDYRYFQADKYYCRYSCNKTHFN